jgi:hypothetical protein
MPGAARQGDILGPGGVLTSPVSSNVFVNGRKVALSGVRYTAHPCCGAKKCPPTHCGGPTFDNPYGVIVNGQIPITRSGVGKCGHKVATSSFNVFFGKRD